VKALLDRVHPLDPLRAPRRSGERAGEIVGLLRDLALAELDDARQVDDLPAIVASSLDGEDVRTACDSPELVRRRPARIVLVYGQARLSADNPFARLGPLDHGVVGHGETCSFEVAAEGRFQGALQGRSIVLVHLSSSVPKLRGHRSWDAYRSDRSPAAAPIHPSESRTDEPSRSHAVAREGPAKHETTILRVAQRRSLDPAHARACPALGIVGTQMSLRRKLEKEGRGILERRTPQNS